MKTESLQSRAKATRRTSEEQSRVRNEAALEWFRTAMTLEDRRQLTLEQLERALDMESTLAAYDVVGLHLAQQALTTLRTGQPVVITPLHVLI